MAEKTGACIAKLDEGIDLIDQRQKLILIADRSEYGWKTVGEYLDNELAYDEQDAKKMKKQKKKLNGKSPNLAPSKPEGSGLVQDLQSTGSYSHFTFT